LIIEELPKTRIEFELISKMEKIELKLPLIRKANKERKK
jgi:hypothetical protein